MVFVCVIRYFRNYLLDKLKEIYYGFFEISEIKWVLIVLVFWDDKVKLFMWNVVEEVWIRKRI